MVQLVANLTAEREIVGSYPDNSTKKKLPFCIAVIVKSCKLVVVKTCDTSIFFLLCLKW